jgi:GNAT superfamily N-acetyltransferase
VAFLGRLEFPMADDIAVALEGFDCVGNRHAGDDVAANVCDFLRSHRYQEGIQHGFSATYLYLDPDADPQLIGYATPALDAVRLTNSEKRIFGDALAVANFGSVRLQMIGVDCRHQGCGYGVSLLEAVTELSRRLSAMVPPRFLLADANVRQVGWYEARGFVPNMSERERGRSEERTVSMRLDLHRSREGGELRQAA